MLCRDQPLTIDLHVLRHVDIPLDYARAPWETYPYRLISWWDMEKFSAARFYRIGTALQMLKEYADDDRKSDVADIDEVAKKAMGEYLRRVSRDCSDTGLVISVKAADKVIALLDGEIGVTFHDQFFTALSHLEQTIEWEMQGVQFFRMPPDQAKFYDQLQLFSSVVSAKFPNIQTDMVEAGNCYAMGRSTACVFHLMRIMELGVREFGKKLGVTLTQDKNWQPILNEVDKTIKALAPNHPDRVAMSEIAANLYSVKLAWRNQVMHPKDTYTLEEAEEILRQVKMFMNNLAGIV
jgi:hypothetical protein